jgi:endonuclease/exonuclease/phosphatase family metal-dependent hydrolase
LNLEPPDVAPRVEAAGLVLANPAAPSYPAHAPRLRIDHVALGAAAAGAVEVVPAGPVSDHRAVMVDAAVPR